MKIVVFGATGGVGKHLLELALAQGHEVTAFARNPAAVTGKDPKLKVVQGDARDAAAVAAAVAGQDVVVSTLGPSGRDPKKNGSMTICSEATPHILAAMKQHGVRRFLCVSSVGIGDSKAHAGFLLNKIFAPLFLKEPFADKEKQEAQVMATDLDWIIIRPSGLHDGPAKGKYKVAMNGPVPARIARADVADFLVKQLTGTEYVRKAPSIGG